MAARPALRAPACRCAAALAAALLAACASPSPPVQLHHLGAAPPVASVPATRDAGVWHLVLPVRVPEYLDREAILLPQAGGGEQGLSGHRWGESLRDSVPRLLRQDLATLLGEARLWPTPLPPGVTATRQLRVELLSLGLRPDRQAVELRARWSLVDPGGAEPPRAESASLVVPTEGDGAGAIVAAHRLALWRLAERIAGTR